MKRFIIIICLILSITLICGCENTQNDNNINNNENNIENNLGDDTMEENITKLNIAINDNTYIATLESNETTKELVKMLPLYITMNELNGNEKYYYMDASLPTNSKNPGSINAGDIMLYGSDCLVIFYKSFDTSYSYTKIGHIDYLPDLGKGNVTVKIEVS